MWGALTVVWFTPAGKLLFIFAGVGVASSLLNKKLQEKGWDKFIPLLNMGLYLTTGWIVGDVVLDIMKTILHLFFRL